MLVYYPRKAQNASRARGAPAVKKKKASNTHPKKFLDPSTKKADDSHHQVLSSTVALRPQPNSQQQNPPPTAHCHSPPPPPPPPQGHPYPYQPYQYYYHHAAPYHYNYQCDCSFAPNHRPYRQQQSQQQHQYHNYHLQQQQQQQQQQQHQYHHHVHHQPLALPPLPSPASSSSDGIATTLSSTTTLVSPGVGPGASSPPPSSPQPRLQQQPPPIPPKVLKSKRSAIVIPEFSSSSSPANPTTTAIALSKQAPPPKLAPAREATAAATAAITAAKKQKSPCRSLTVVKAATAATTTVAATATAAAIGVVAAANERTLACDVIAAKLDAVLTSIDSEGFSGREEDLCIRLGKVWDEGIGVDRDEGLLNGGDAGYSDSGESSRSHAAMAADEGFTTERSLLGGQLVKVTSCPATKAVSKVAVQAPKKVNVFAKVNLYANSRLPAWLPALKLYLPSYPLICLAAQFSERVYLKPMGKEKETHVDSDWRMGTKAMVVKSVPMDDMNAVVIAIRGSQTFMDWTVNLNSEPASPENFLEDAGNLCHAGFLSVARKMIAPIAARLRSLLEEDPGRSSCSLIMTGHSAGGAVASLLYAHMLGQKSRSELSVLAGCFKRIHCITFGAPPVSLLPLSKPEDKRYHKSMFFSFVNEGDPVTRADKPYVRSLLDLYSSTAPKPIPLLAPFPNGTNKPSILASNTITDTIEAPPVKPSRLGPLALLKPGGNKPRPQAPRKSYSAPASNAIVANNLPPSPQAVWPVPPCTLSNAGRCVLLRPRPRIPGSTALAPPGGNGNGGSEAEEDVVASVVTDAEMRGVVWGDPVMHMMRVYRRRVEVLATRAVLGEGGNWG